MTVDWNNILVKCKYCGSADVVKCGSYNGVQRYWCKSCRHKFKDDNHLYHMRVPVQYVSDALDMYFKGITVNNIRTYLQKTYDYCPPRSVIHQWLGKYIDRAIGIFKDNIPEVGDIWLASETMLKLGKRNVWIFDIFDCKTGFLLASHTVARRKVQSFKLTMQKAYSKAGREPKLVIAYMSYYAFDALEGRAFNCKTEHIIRGKSAVTGDNKEVVESFESMIQERLTVLHKLRTYESVCKFLDGWFVHYNYFELFSLSGVTPAQSAGIDHNVKSWLDVCRQSSVEFSS